MALPQIADNEMGDSVRTKLNNLLLGGVSASRSLASGAGTITPTTQRVVLTGTAGAGFDLTIANGAVIGELFKVVVSGSASLAGFTINLVDAVATTIVGSIRANHVYWLVWDGSTWLNDGRALRNANPLLATDFASGAVIPVNGDLDFSGATPGQALFWDGTVWSGDDLPSGPAPSVLPIATTPRLLTIDERVEDGVLLLADTGSGVVRVPKTAPEGTWRLRNNTSSTVEVEVEDDAGTLNGASGGATPVFLAAGVGREVLIDVVGNAGTAPTVQVNGATTETKVLDGDLDFADKVASRPELRDVAETVVAKGTLATGAISYDYSAGGYQWGTTGAGNITSVTITNPPATGKLGCITLEFVQGATPRTIAWGGAFRFPGGTAFTLTASAGAIDIFTFITRDGGTTWYGFEGGKAFAA